MTDPIVTVAASEVLNLAFNAFIKSGASESAKKLTGTALTKADELQQRIVSWFQSKQDKKAEEAISAIQEQGSLSAFNKLTTYLDDEMEENPNLALELKSYIQSINEVSSSTYQVVVEDSEVHELEVENVKQEACQSGNIVQKIINNAKITGKASVRNINQKG